MGKLFTEEEKKKLLSLFEEELDELNKNSHNRGYLFDEETNDKLAAIEEKEKNWDELLPPYGITHNVQVIKYITKNLVNPDMYAVLITLYFADKLSLLEHAQYVSEDRYIKTEYGPIPKECYDILKFVKGEINDKFDESIKEELRIDSNEKIYCLKDIEFDYLSVSDIECLDKGIKEYKDSTYKELMEKYHDEIYDSVNLNEEITEIHMANILDPSGDLTEYLEGDY